ncbi:hypothetical protein ACHAW6_004644 [Cyclotella cf. meneghiniana]
MTLLAVALLKWSARRVENDATMVCFMVCLWHGAGREHKGIDAHSGKHLRKKSLSSTYISCIYTIEQHTIPTSTKAHKLSLEEQYQHAYYLNDQTTATTALNRPTLRQAMAGEASSAADNRFDNNDDGFPVNRSKE